MVLVLGYYQDYFFNVKVNYCVTIIYYKTILYYVKVQDSKVSQVDTIC